VLLQVAARWDVLSPVGNNQTRQQREMTEGTGWATRKDSEGLKRRPSPNQVLILTHVPLGLEEGTRDAPSAVVPYGVGGKG
jgi:hypothetical protein